MAALSVSFQFCLSNVCLMSVFACSCCADGAEQEESASVCEYVLQFALRFQTSFSNESQEFLYSSGKISAN